MKLQDRITIIYTLSCPITGQIKYVGKTAKSLRSRLRVHIADSKIIMNKRANWVRSLVNKGLEPIIEPLEEVVEDWESAERYWISQMKAWGFDLKNATEGGEGQLGRKVSAESRKKMSEWQKGIKKPKEVAEKSAITRSITGNCKKTPEWKYKISQSKKGRKYGDEYKENCRKRMAGRRLTWVLRPITQFTKTGEFVANYDCVRDAANSLGILESSISMCVNGKSKSSGGYVWKPKFDRLAIDAKTLK